MYIDIFSLHANLLKALSHPKRLEIIHLLRDQTLSVTAMLEMTGLPQANLSQHLIVLRRSGVVTSKKSGKQIFYSLAHENFIKTSDLMREVLLKTYQGSQLEKDLCIDTQDLFPLALDPVCHMRLSPKTASFTCKFGNRSYFFCASGCLTGFKRHPHKYLTNED